MWLDLNDGISLLPLKYKKINLFSASAQVIKLKNWINRLNFLRQQNSNNQWNPLTIWFEPCKYLQRKSYFSFCVSWSKAPPKRSFQKVSERELNMHAENVLGFLHLNNELMTVLIYCFDFESFYSFSWRSSRSSWGSPSSWKWEWIKFHINLMCSQLFTFHTGVWLNSPFERWSTMMVPRASHMTLIVVRNRSLHECKSMKNVLHINW